MKMWTRASFVLCGLLNVAGCPQNTEDTSRSSPTGAVVVGNASFSVSLPTSSKPITFEFGIPGATFLKTLTDSSDHLYIVYTIPADSVASFDSSAVDFSTVYNGVGRTSSGDFVVFTTATNASSELCSALALLSDGQFLYVGTDCSNPARTSVFASIDLADTDGASLSDVAKTGVPTLSSPAPSGVVVLSDDSAYRVSGPTDTRQVAAWARGDAVYPYEAGQFVPSAGHPFFLMNIGEWRSVPASYVGVARRASLVRVSDAASTPVGTGATLSLGNGTSWTSSVLDAPRARSWGLNSEVAVLDDAASPTRYTVVNLVNGDNLAVSPR